MRRATAHKLSLPGTTFLREEKQLGPRLPSSIPCHSHWWYEKSPPLLPPSPSPLTPGHACLAIGREKEVDSGRTLLIQSRRREGGMKWGRRHLAKSRQERGKTKKNPRLSTFLPSRKTKRARHRKSFSVLGGMGEGHPHLLRSSAVPYSESSTSPYSYPPPRSRGSKDYGESAASVDRPVQDLLQKMHEAEGNDNNNGMIFPLFPGRPRPSPSCPYYCLVLWYLLVRTRAVRASCFIFV